MDSVRDDLLSDTVDFLIFMDNYGIITRCNNKTLQLLGYTSKSLIGTSIKDLIIEGPLNMIRNSLDEPGDREFNLKNYELQFKTSSGSLIGAVVSISTVNDRLHQQAGYRILGKDYSVSEQLIHEMRDKQMIQDNLIEYQKRYQTLVEMMPYSVLLISGKSVIYMNQSAQDLFHISEIMDLETAEILNLIHPGDRSSMEKLIADLTRESPVTEMEVRLRFDGVSEKVCRLLLKWLNYNGADAVLMILEDISQLRKHEAWTLKLSYALEQSSNMVAITDLEGNIEYINQKFSDVTGYSLKEILNNKISLLSKGMNPPSIYSKLFDALENGKAWSGEFQNLRKNGEFYWEYARISPIYNKEGDIVNYLKVSEDITEKRKIQETMIKADKLDSLGLMAGGIAHDFNNLLTAIVGNLSIAKMTALSDPVLSPILEDAEKAAYQARSLTHQLLSISRGGEFHTETVVIEPLLKENVVFALRGTRIVSRFEMDVKLKPVDADRSQLIQVVNNIVINAVQAMPDGGEIVVKAVSVNLDQNNRYGLPAGEYDLLSFKDCGSGIRPEILSKIFDPYFTTKKNGNGLGLASCYSIIKKHGGVIDVESTPGAGTEFFVYLPVSRKIEAVVKENKPRIPTGCHGKILVMDDEVIITSLIKKVLERFGFEVEVADNGQAAIELYEDALKNSRFDLVILDLTVPGGLGGKETFVRLKEIDPQVKGVLSSGYSKEMIQAVKEEFGFAGVIQKPYKIDELVHYINDVICGK